MSKLNHNEKKPKSLDKNTKKINNQDKKTNNTLLKRKLSLPQITPSTEKLQNKISEFKNQHAQITKTLEEAILNNNLYRSISASELQNQNHIEFLDKRHSRKQKSLVNLQKNMQKRIELNEEAQNRIQKMEKEVSYKKSTVAKRLTQLQSRNLQKIQQIQDFEKQFLEKVKWELNKNLERQKKLKKDFEKIKQDNVKLVKTKQFQNKLDKEAWKSLMDQKINLEALMQSQKKRQIKLLEEKNPEIAKKQEKIAAQKQESKKTVREKVKLDAKQAGKRYLDFAKKRASVATKEGSKVKHDYMNINLKVINYQNQILQRIGNNDGILSTKQQEENILQQSLQIVETKTQKAQKNYALNQLQMNIIPILQQQQQESQVSQSSQFGKTVNLAKRIKRNIQEIEQKYQKN